MSESLNLLICLQLFGGDAVGAEPGDQRETSDEPFG